MTDLHALSGLSTRFAGCYWLDTVGRNDRKQTASKVEKCISSKIARKLSAENLNSRAVIV